MGAGQSAEKVIYNETPIQFSTDLVNRLSDEHAAPETNSAQQSVLDHHVRSRIQAEIARLRDEEEEVRAQIEQALERENIDREKKLAMPDADEDVDGIEGSGVSGPIDGAVRSSASLMEDLKEVQSKVERFHRRRSLDDVPEVKATSETLVECYRQNQKTSLNCWKEVAEFKDSVARAEQKFINTLH